MLRVIDTRWMDHLQEMDYLKEGIGLRAMGQRDPLVEYKEEGFAMFGGLVRSINEDFLRTIMHIEFVFEPVPQQAAFSGASYSGPAEGSIFGHAAAAADQFGLGGPSQDQIAAASAAAGGGERPAVQQVVKDVDDPWANVGRNDPCPCGSGKKYKRCHGANA